MTIPVDRMNRGAEEERANQTNRAERAGRKKRTARTVRADSAEERTNQAGRKERAACPDPDAGRFFGEALLAWYRRERRDLPWRRTRDPYAIWVSEIMLQQTRVETVIPYYRRFMERFPTIRALAAAPEEDVLKAWEGLGYYSRARNLRAAARQLMELHGGTFPSDKASVSELKGIGPYTAGAILSIAFDQPEPAVDGNVMRVLSRFFDLDGDIAKPAVRAGLEKLAKELIPEGEAAAFNQALMELGALVCVPRSPGCLSCPVMERCAGRLAGRERELPVKTKAKAPRPEYRLAALIESGGRVLVRQRPDEGLLARMWELPHTEAPNESVWSAPDAAADWMRGALDAEGLRIRPTACVGETEHIFTHLHWHVKIWSAELYDVGIADGAGGNDGGAFLRETRQPYRWVGKRELAELALPKMFKTLLEERFGFGAEADDS